MNDLTRRVLADAAPILARQVEAVEKLAEDFHRWAQADRAKGHVDDALDKEHTALSIRNALNSVY